MLIPKSSLGAFNLDAIGIPLLREGYTTDMNRNDPRLYAGEKIMKDWHTFQCKSSEYVCDSLIDSATYHGCTDVSIAVSPTHHRMVFSYRDKENPVRMDFPIRGL